MYKLARPFFMLCESPLHAGSGNNLGVIDLPIQRERHTGFPKIEASGLKGCLRDVFERMSKIKLQNQTVTDEQDRQAVVKFMFGPETGNEHAAALGFTDARLLLFPVKSMKGVFAWVTCPKVLSRFANDLRLCNLEPSFPVPKACSAARDSNLFVKDKDNKIVLEEYTFEIKHKDDEDVTRLAEWLAEHALPQGEEYDYLREKIRKDIVVLGDDDFRDFVHLSTEIVTRIRINNKKGTVQKGALFTEEYLPSETLLYAMVLVSPVFDDQNNYSKFFNENEENIMKAFLDNKANVLQLGGNTTIGKGLVRMVSLDA